MPSSDLNLLQFGLQVINVIKTAKKSLFYWTNKKITKVPSSERRCPFSSSGKLKLMTRVVNSCVSTMVEIIGENVGQDREMDFYLMFQGLTCDVIGECALAIKVTTVDVNKCPALAACGKKNGPSWLHVILNIYIKSRAGHVRYNKNYFFAVNSLFLHQSYLKSPLPVKLTW